MSLVCFAGRGLWIVSLLLVSQAMAASDVEDYDATNSPNSPHQPLEETVALLETAAEWQQPGEVTRSMPPGGNDYRNLRGALLDYLAIHERGGWPTVAAQGPVLQTGMSDEEIGLLRQQLWVMGDMGEPQEDNSVYNDDLEQAVRRFQLRHGLLVDGVTGKQTRAALSVPVEQRIQQLRVNLERLPQQPADRLHRYITVNTAAFELQVHEQDRIPVSMKIIAGRTDRKTPVFTEQLRYLVFNPYWNVPTRLAVRDLIPAQVKDPGYFGRKGIRVLSSWRADAVELDIDSIDWQSYLQGSPFRYKLQQLPGEKNALGVIKFMMPNTYSVYLHDTPSKHLFNKPVRAFSSGCIRLENPLELASYLLGGGAPVEEQINQWIEQGTNRAIALPEPLPVHVIYQTAWVDAAGNVQFRRDIYRRDAGILATLDNVRPDAKWHTADENGANTTTVSQLQ